MISAGVQNEEKQVTIGKLIYDKRNQAICCKGRQSRKELRHRAGLEPLPGRVLEEPFRNKKVKRLGSIGMGRKVIHVIFHDLTLIFVKLH